VPRTLAAAEDLEAVLRQRHGGARVLLVEDNPTNRELALALLESVGLLADLADNGEAAVQCVRRQHYELALMDLQMPVMDGLEATRRIRNSPGGAALPIVAMSANASAEDRAACLAAGMDDHVAKPVDLQAFYAALLQWLPGRPGSAQGGLPGIAGLDMVRALHHAGGRSELLGRVLQQFAAHYAPIALDAAARPAAADRDAWRALAHSIKGAATSIGARRLPGLAEALEAALAGSQPDDRVAGATANLLGELAGLVAALQASAGAPPAAAAAAAPAPSDDDLDALLALVAAADFDALAQYRRLADGMRARFGGAAADVEAPLRNFDYPQAHAALVALRAPHD
jgi:CheY-like chemotaxis protein